VFFSSFCCTFVNGTASPDSVVVVPVFVVEVVAVVVVDFLLPLASTFADFVVLVFVGFAAFVVDFTGFEVAVLTGFEGLLVVLTDTGFTFDDVGLTDVVTDACGGLGGFVDFGLGPP
jgi:hypothetical protein